MAIEAARLMTVVGYDTSEAESGIAGFNNKLNRAAKNLASTGAGLSAAFTVPLVGIATAAVNTAGEFQQNMNILQQVIGGTQSDMSMLSDEALRLGAVTSFSAGEAAAAMLELGKAGMDTNDIMASIGGVLDLAAAGGIDLANAASITAAALNAFHLEASQSTRVANLLAATANASAADITDLAQGLKQAGFAFDLANQPIENLAASLAILTNVGLTGSDAGTALKNAFMRMINPTAEAAGVMKDLGISFYDASGQMMALPDIIENLNVAMAGLTPQQRDAALATIFLSDGMKAMVPLLNAGSDGFNQMVTAVTKAGAATDVANARMSGFRGGIEYLKGSVDSFLISQAMPFLDTLGNLARSAGDLVTAFGALPAPTRNAAYAFAAVLAAAGPLTLGLSGVAAALAFLSSPIGLVITASAALAAAWVADFGGIQEITATVMSSAQQWFATTAAGAQALAASVQTAFGNTSFPSLQTLWEQFQAGDFQTVADTIRNTAFDLMVNLDTELNITGQANALKQQLIGAVTGLGTAIQGLDFGAAKANLDGLRDGILSGISTAIDGVDWGQGGSTFAGMIDSLTTGVQNLDFSSINWADVFKRALLGPAGAALGALQWVIGSAEFEGLKTSVKGAIGSIDWGDLGVSFTGLGAAIATQVGGVFADMGSDIMAEIPPINIDWGQLAIDTVGLAGSVTERINSTDWSGIGTSIGSGILGAVTGAVGAINWVAETSETLRAQALGLALNVGLEIGNALRGVNLFEVSAQLQGSIQAAFIKMFAGAASSISGQLAVMLDLPEVDWATLIGDFEWTTFIPEHLSWRTFIPIDLTWSTFIPANLNWRTFVPADLSWETFIPDNLSWADWIDPVNWGDWLGGLFGIGSPASNASGTSNFSGGVTWVGERGPELVSLPRGTRIYNNQESMALAAGGTTINVYVDHINNDMDLESLANKLAQKFQKKVR